MLNQTETEQDGQSGLPSRARITTTAGRTYSGELSMVTFSGAQFMRVGVRSMAVLVQLSQVAEIKPLKFADKTMSEIIDATALEFDVKRSDITGRSKLQHIVAARHAVWYCAFQLGVGGYSGIGSQCGFDHGSIMHGVKRAAEMRDHQRGFKARLDRILESFQRERAP